jgi:hypothetical protein
MRLQLQYIAFVCLLILLYAWNTNNDLQLKGLSLELSALESKVFPQNDSLKNSAGLLPYRPSNTLDFTSKVSHQIKPTAIVKNGIAQPIEDTIEVPIPEKPIALQWLADSIEQTNIAITAFEKTKPKKPKLATEGRYRFTIDADMKEHPELSGYTDITYEVEPTDTRFSTRAYEVVWHDGKLQRCGEDSYELYLISEKEKMRFAAYPVFKQKAFGKAIKVFERKLKAYQKELKKLLDKKNSLQQQFDDLHTTWLKELQEIEAKVNAKGRGLG